MIRVVSLFLLLVTVLAGVVSVVVYRTPYLRLHNSSCLASPVSSEPVQCGQIEQRWQRSVTE